MGLLLLLLFVVAAVGIKFCLNVSEQVAGRSGTEEIGGAAQGVTISEVKTVVWQLPRPQNAVLKIPKVTVSDQEALQQRERGH